MGEQINMLSHLSTLEVSNVRRAANKKRYAISKSETPMKIQQVLSVAAEGEEQFVATLKSQNASPERIEAATAAYRLQKNCADLLKPEDFGVTAKAFGKGEPDGDEQGEDESDEEFKARKAKKAAKKAAKSADVVVAPVAKSASEDPRFEVIMKSNETLAAQVKELVEKNEQLEFEAVAKSEFGHVRGSFAEIAGALKAAHAAGPEAEKVFKAALKSAEEITAKSAMLGELGTNGGPSSGGGSWQKIEALASGLTMKSEKGTEMSRAQKIDYVVSKTAEGRALYEQYNEEKRQLLKKI